MNDNMKKCNSCGADIAKSAKVCPNCGAKNKKPIYKRVWFWILIAFLVIAVISAGSGSSENTNTNSPAALGKNNAPASDNSSQQAETPTATPKEEKKEDFTIEGDVATESDAFTTYITGIIKNNTDKEKSYVQVTFNLYDSSGNQIGTAIDNINNLASGGTWKFKAAALTSDGFASYELAEISGW